MALPDDVAAIAAVQLTGVISWRVRERSEFTYTEREIASLIFTIYTVENATEAMVIFSTKQ